LLRTEAAAIKLDSHFLQPRQPDAVSGADCGMGGRVHAEIGWTKLAALAEGAALATKTLWH
jgi:5-methyltetrahydropteroyltriglutamate--homocysteine methyltransferase